MKWLTRLVSRRLSLELLKSKLINKKASKWFLKPDDKPLFLINENKLLIDR